MAREKMVLRWSMPWRRSPWADCSYRLTRNGEAILAEASRDPLLVLWDKAVAPLPIYRAQPDDPDHENTLATAVFRIGAHAINWQVYDRAGEAPRYTMDGKLMPG